jgi:histidinol dehydrogenase
LKSLKYIRKGEGMKTVRYGSAEMRHMMENLEGLRTATQRGIEAGVQAIWYDISQRGWQAVVEYSVEFDGVEPIEISSERLAQAWETIPKELRRALQRAHDNAVDYQRHLIEKDSVWKGPNGTLGQLVRPLQRVGIYVPGGTAAYPSSVLANAVPAKTAGVKEVILTTPPTRHLKESVLAAAYIAGVDRVFAIGGVQAIAALTHGCGVIPKADKIVGPGNAYVTAAKRLAYGKTDIDAIAGPSDICIIADETANPEYIAADLLSQAEHDILSQAVLLSTSDRICSETEQFIDLQLNGLPRRGIAEKSWNDFGMIVCCDTVDNCVSLANEIAPEHLEIITADPRSLLPRINTAGAVFLGPYTPESVGDYLAGPSHVLPTYGTARFFSPLSASSFLKKISLIEYTQNDLKECADDIITIAAEEGLDGHAYAVAVRRKENSHG